MKEMEVIARSLNDLNTRKLELPSESVGKFLKDDGSWDNVDSGMVIASDWLIDVLSEDLEGSATITAEQYQELVDICSADKRIICKVTDGNIRLILDPFFLNTNDDGSFGDIAFQWWSAFGYIAGYLWVQAGSDGTYKATKDKINICYNTDYSGNITNEITQISTHQTMYDFYEGSNTVTTIASVPVTKRLVIANLSASESFTLATTPSAGREIHIIANSTSDTDITITMPTESPYVNLGEGELTIAASGYAEINIISDGTNMYIRSI